MNVKLRVRHPLLDYTVEGFCFTQGRNTVDSLGRPVAGVINARTGWTEMVYLHQVINVEILD